MYIERIVIQIRKKAVKQFFIRCILFFNIQQWGCVLHRQGKCCELIFFINKEFSLHLNKIKFECFSLIPSYVIYNKHN